MSKEFEELKKSLKRLNKNMEKYTKSIIDLTLHLEGCEKECLFDWEKLDEREW
jgi:hypothetical protein